jgi:hypothetical protein
MWSVSCCCCDVSALVQFVSVQLRVANRSTLLAFMSAYATVAHLLACVNCVVCEHL